MGENILIVEDDLDMAEILRQGLNQETYCVSVAHNGGKGLEMARAAAFDAIVLDVMLPVLDGYSLARQLRAGGNATPILMLTALDSTSDIVTGLDAGAEDYLVKPFSFIELLARLRALTRRGKPQPKVLCFGGLKMDTLDCEVTRDGCPISLTRTEYMLLKVLLQNAGHLVSREEIVAAVWGPRAAVEQNSIDVFVRTLRGKIDYASPDKLIHTLRGLGYKLARTHAGS